MPNLFRHSAAALAALFLSYFTIVSVATVPAARAATVVALPVVA